MSKSSGHREGESQKRVRKKNIRTSKLDASIILRNSLEKLVANAFQVDETLLRMPTRGRAQIARARQVAMYLAHTACGHSLTEVGKMFERDRTTVAHACTVIEAARDDASFDRALELLESSARLMQAHAVLPMVLDQDDTAEDE